MVRGVKDLAVGKRLVVDNGLFKVVSVGNRKGTVVAYVDCKGSYSFDYPSFCLLVELVKRDLGVVDGDVVEVRSLELNVDYKNLQLDGVQSLTLKGFMGAFERIYNKDRHTLRSEVNLQMPLTVEAAYTLLKGGITPYNIFQSNFMLVKKVEALTEAVKFSNRTQAQFVTMMKEHFERLWKDRETTKKRGITE